MKNETLNHKQKVKERKSEINKKMLTSEETERGRKPKEDLVPPPRYLQYSRHIHQRLYPEHQK